MAESKIIQVGDANVQVEFEATGSNLRLTTTSLDGVILKEIKQSVDYGIIINYRGTYISSRGTESKTAENVNSLEFTKLPQEEVTGDVHKIGLAYEKECVATFELTAQDGSQEMASLSIDVPSPW